MHSADPELIEDFLAAASGGTPSPRLLELQGRAPKDFERALQEARTLLAHVNAARLEEPSEASVDRARALIREGTWGKLVRALKASLVAPTEPALAVRTSALSLHALYKIEDYELDLGLQPGVALIGQVVHADESLSIEGRATLYSPSGLTLASEVHPHGDFLFAQPPRPPFDVIVELSDVTLCVSDFDPRHRSESLGDEA
ncbi:MAG: hypothetical protein ACYSWX_10645 [Planctomycetota bacterium]|jgi:hypothetical protein